jgi:hypothetical protein
MAEILIKRRKHWAEDEKPAEWSTMKWNGGPKQGDVVEVREDGYWRVEHLKIGKHGWNRDAFALIRVPGVKVGDLKYLKASYDNATELQPQATVTYKNRYRFEDWNLIAWNKNKITSPTSGKTFDEWYYDFGTKTALESEVADKAS